MTTKTTCARSADKMARFVLLRSLERLGIPSEAVLAGELEAWDALDAELDRFSAYGYGPATQRRYLHTPHPRLEGITPIEALREPGGIARVRAAVNRTLQLAEYGAS